MLTEKTSHVVCNLLDDRVRLEFTVVDVNSDKRITAELKQTIHTT